MTSPPHPTPAAPGGPHRAPTFSGFALRLLLYLFLVSLIFSLGGLHMRMEPIQRFIASTATAGARYLGTTADVDGTIIRTNHVALDINHECTGIFVLLVYATFVLAYPASGWQRTYGIVLGVGILTTINVARLVVLTVIAGDRPTWFAYFHEYFFQGLFIALLAFLASVWTEQVRRATISRVSV